jgi:hypothetical protein
VNLSNEDTLRLNVLLANDVKAVRIDENSMTLHALLPGKEAEIQLKPDCRSDQYVKRVREFLSGHVLGSPGGYPVYLKRWTRMGQAKDESLTDLLVLGEPEAVVAVACAPGLTDELAQRVWWIEQSADTARRMLASPHVAQGSMGKVLAEFLVEFLPFETEPLDILHTVRLLLQPGLIDDETRLKIWERGKNKPIFRVGFLEIAADNLPEPVPAHSRYSEIIELVMPLANSGNAAAVFFGKLFSESGQTFVTHAANLLKKPSSQEAVLNVFDAIARFFSPLNMTDDLSKPVSIDAIHDNVDQLISQPTKQLADLVRMAPDLSGYLRTAMVLSFLNEQMLMPMFASSSAVGSVLRKQVKPVTEPVMQELHSLLQ